MDRRELAPAPQHSRPSPRPIGMDLSTRLYRSRSDRMIAGVAGGMAEYFGIDPTLVRLLWALTLLPGGVPGLLLYLVCWAVIPSNPQSHHSGDFTTRS